jgi:hypothetical protein
MRMVIKKQIGNRKYAFQVEGKNIWECQMEAQKLSFRDVYKCGLCGSEHLYLRAYKTKEGYKYIKVCCANPDCRASVTFGEKQNEEDVYYLRKNEDRSLKWEKYEGNNGGGNLGSAI